MALELERVGTQRSQELVFFVAKRAEETPEKGGLVLDPAFQRGSVWATAQKQAWIESLLSDVPLPAFFLNRFPSSHPTYRFGDVVIDGQQRIRATLGFTKDEFKVRGEFWSEQTDEFKRRFTMGGPVCPVVYTAFEDEADCVRLYLKLLTAGTAHTTAEIGAAQVYLKKLEAAKKKVRK